MVRKSPNPTAAPTTPIPRQAATRKIMEKLILPITSVLPISIPGRNIRYGIVINPYAAGSPVKFDENR